jgi:RNA polymerase sigma-70 factor (ECF subfamily)
LTAATGDLAGDFGQILDISVRNPTPAATKVSSNQAAWPDDSKPAHALMPATDPPIKWPQQLSQHRRWLLSVLRNRVSNPHAVEDLYQEVSLAVLRQTSRPTDPQKVAPWLYRLAVRQVINFHRRNGRQKRLQESIRRQTPAVSATAPDALDWLLRSEQHSRVNRALQQLRPQDREILVLKYTENWTYKQLARHLGASTNTIEYRLIRARKRLRQLLSCDLVNDQAARTANQP